MEYVVSGCHDCPFYSGGKRNHLCRLDWRAVQKKERLIEQCKLPEEPATVILKKSEQ